jgi:hypothetical protein
MTCPAALGGLRCRRTASLANWKSAIAMATTRCRAGTFFDATYDNAATSAICNNNAMVDPKW